MLRHTGGPDPTPNNTVLFERNHPLQLRSRIASQMEVQCKELDALIVALPPLQLHDPLEPQVSTSLSYDLGIRAVATHVAQMKRTFSGAGFRPKLRTLFFRHLGLERVTRAPFLPRRGGSQGPKVSQEVRGRGREGEGRGLVLVLDLAKALVRVTLPIVWAWATHSVRAPAANAV